MEHEIEFERVLQNSFHVSGLRQAKMKYGKSLKFENARTCK